MSDIEAVSVLLALQCLSCCSVIMAHLSREFTVVVDDAPMQCQCEYLGQTAGLCIFYCVISANFSTVFAVL